MSGHTLGGDGVYKGAFSSLQAAKPCTPEMFKIFIALLSLTSYVSTSPIVVENPGAGVEGPGAGLKFIPRAIFSAEPEPIVERAIFSAEAEPIVERAIFSAEAEPIAERAVFSDEAEPIEERAIFAAEAEPIAEGAE
ncbi:hypothetical protein B0H12DRAFT_1149462 [Mycena haematopus]|nr:hypothetical protein B0H12DRAFT_1149462 [Mycena haematopus]